VFYSDEEVRDLVTTIGVEVVGARYAARTRESLDTISRGQSPTSADQDADPESWIDDAVAFGDCLDCETRFRLVMAAIIAAAAEDDVLWCIADMPVDHLVDDCSLYSRFHDARQDNPAVDRMFRLMQMYYLETLRESDAGWWADDWVSHTPGLRYRRPAAGRPPLQLYT
jgi:hypothetical protein